MGCRGWSVVGGMALSNSFGFGGHNVCLAVRRFDG
jgi:3-oxoacyl-(acyl-carrier-protein) synthase